MSISVCRAAIVIASGKESGWRRQTALSNRGLSSIGKAMPRAAANAAFNVAGSSRWVSL